MPVVGVRAVRSRRVFVNHPTVRRYLESEIDSTVKPHFIKAFERVVANWKHKPQFKARKYLSTDEIKIAVFPAGENKQIWRYVSEGTRPHKIRAKNARTLAFNWGGHGSYKPKTKPPGKFGGPGIVVGGTMRFPVEVNHPGNEARNFEKTIKDDEKAWFSRTMENTWRRAIRRMQ